MANFDWKRKLGSRKFWAFLAAIAVSVLALFRIDEATTGQIVALITAVGSCAIYMLAEGIVDSAGARMEVDVIDVIEKDSETRTRDSVTGDSRNEP